MAGFKDINEILSTAQATLKLARMGFNEYLRGETATHRKVGLRNAIMFGRSVTFNLQQIRTFQRDAFNAWYEPYETEMRQNSGFKYLVELRNQLDKEGRDAPIKVSLNAKNINTARIQAAMKTPPPGAIGWVMDMRGATGWKVPQADGSEEIYYVDLPQALQDDMQITSTQRFAEPITPERGAPVPAPSEPIDQVISKYFDYLERLIASAQRQFRHK